MPLDTRLPLLGQGVDVQSAMINAQNLRSGRTQNALQQFALQQQQAAKPLVDAKTQNDLQIERVRANLIMSERVRSLMAGGNTQAAVQFLEQTRNQRQSAGQQTQLVDAYLADIQSENYAALKSKMDEGLMLGQRFGIPEAGSPAQAPEPYTLAPGAQRRGPNNELLAENRRDTAESSPFAKINPSLYTQESVQRFEQSGNYGDLVTKATGDVSPFAKIDPSKYTQESLARFERTGRVSDLVPITETERAENPFARINPKDFTPESVAAFEQSGNYGDLRAIAESDGSGTGPIVNLISRDNEVRTLRRDSPEAQALLDSGNWGEADTRTDPIDGSVTIFNPITQQGVPMEVPFQRGPVGAVPEGETLFAQAEIAGGPVASLAEKGSFITSVLFDVSAGETIQARTTFDTEKNALIRALSLNPRYPVGEIERLEREMNLSPSVFNTGSILQQRLIAIVRTLDRRATILEDNFKNRDLSRQQRNEDAATARAIREFIAVSGVTPAMMAPELNQSQRQRLEALRQQQGAGDTAP